MASAPYMPLYTSDYLGDTGHLTTEQHGAYMLLLMQMWNAGGKLPNNKQILARIARCSTKKWLGMADIILEFFEDHGSEISHNRLTKERQKVEGKIEKRRNAGALGGAAKALKDKERGLANAKAKGVEKPCHSPEPEPSTSSEVDIPCEVQQAFDAYVKVAARLKAERGDTVWPVNITLTPERRAKLKARIKEHGLAAWGVVLRKAAASPHCTGANGWAADFDFLAGKKGFLKTLEGNYDDRTAKIHSINGGRSEGRSGISGRGPDSFDRLAERLAGNTTGANAGADAERGGADEGVIDAEFTWAAG